MWSVCSLCSIKESNRISYAFGSNWHWEVLVAPNYVWNSCVLFTICIFGFFGRNEWFQLEKQINCPESSFVIAARFCDELKAPPKHNYFVRRVQSHVGIQKLKMIWFIQCYNHNDHNAIQNPTWDEGREWNVHKIGSLYQTIFTTVPLITCYIAPNAAVRSTSPTIGTRHSPTFS